VTGFVEFFVVIPLHRFSGEPQTVS
jgi:hypothetical protein